MWLDEIMPTRLEAKCPAQGLCRISVACFCLSQCCHCHLLSTAQLQAHPLLFTEVLSGKLCLPASSLMWDSLCICKRLGTKCWHMAIELLFTSWTKLCAVVWKGMIASFYLSLFPEHSVSAYYVIHVLKYCAFKTTTWKCMSSLFHLMELQQ